MERFRIDDSSHTGFDLHNRDHAFNVPRDLAPGLRLRAAFGQVGWDYPVREAGRVIPPLVR